MTYSLTAAQREHYECQGYFIAREILNSPLK